MHRDLVLSRSRAIAALHLVELAEIAIGVDCDKRRDGAEVIAIRTLKQVGELHDIPGDEVGNALSAFARAAVRMAEALQHD